MMMGSERERTNEVEEWRDSHHFSRTVCHGGPCGTCIGTIKASRIFTECLELAKLSILFGRGDAGLALSRCGNSAVLLNVS